MNIIERDIMNAMAKRPYENQRLLASDSGYSLGVTNKSIKSLIKDGYLDEEMDITEKARIEFREKAPQNAVILAAGFGMRMVPINTETTKGLLEVKGEPLVERLITQLHEVGIHEIYVVVGYMKEQYEYLIDSFGVKLVVNADYASKNNLYSLKQVLKYLGNTYIVPCDIWCKYNPFRKNELYSWYMVSNYIDRDSNVRVNRKKELITVQGKTGGNAMVGISYLTKPDAEIVKIRIQKFAENSRYDDAFWEEVLYQDDKMILASRMIQSEEVMEIDTYEQLRELDSDSNHLKTEAISIIAEVLNVQYSDILDITVLKKGMTNRSFLFSCNQKKYIMRIPGEGTDRLINRAEEAEVYQTIKSLGICDEIIYINSENGYKITEYLENTRVCDPFAKEDIEICMKKLREFHQLDLKVSHEFNIFGLIEFYEVLWEGNPSVYRDYKKTKGEVLSLKTYIDKHVQKKVLTHIDAVPDNFLILSGGEVRLIDWEYAGMQDPHVDVAMFCIYSLYDRDMVDCLIQTYFKGECSRENKIKIYCYIAACGLLWSNWCEYKKNLGIEFGEYSLRQYRYAKDYYRIVQEELRKEGEISV